MASVSYQRLTKSSQ